MRQTKVVVAAWAQRALLRRQQSRRRVPRDAVVSPLGDFLEPVDDSLQARDCGRSGPPLQGIHAESDETADEVVVVFPG